MSNADVNEFSGNGYIEGKELQNFIKELQQARKQAGLVSLNHIFIHIYINFIPCIVRYKLNELWVIMNG